VLNDHRGDHRPARQEADEREERRVRGCAQRLGFEPVASEQAVGNRQVLVRVGERDVEAAEDERQADDEREQRQADGPGA
jgi:hypothetical protein